MKPWRESSITFEEWKRSELVILRGIARRCSAVMQEGSDPALNKTRDKARELLYEWQSWRNYGLSRGWQP